MSYHLPFTSRLTFPVALWCSLFLCLFSPLAHSQGGIPAEQLTRLKAATVLVLVDAPGEEASGSGFLIAKEGGRGYIATNEHVVDTETKTGRGVKVVLNSGVPNAQVVLNAQVVAEDSFRDLAILSVASNSLPEPLKLSASQPPRETMPVWVFGFPFGEMLSTSKMHPSVTVTTGTVTSLRLDDFGKVARVQVDADINEGNSGGPIVDSTGALIGIATEKVEDTKIGLGLPNSELQEMLQGRVRDSSMQLLGVKDGTATYQATARLIDPLRRVRSVSAFFVPKAQAESIKPNAQGRYEQMTATMSEFPLSLKADEYSARVSFKNAAKADVDYWEQIRLELGNGQFKWTQPVSVTVPFSQNFAPTNPNNQPRPGTTGNAPSSNDGDWLGGAAVPQVGVGVPAKPLQPIASDRLILGDVQSEAGANYREVNVGGKVTPTMLWSNDGKFLYLLEETGILHKVSVPEFREQRVVRVEQKTTFMTLSRAGLAIGLPLLQEVWLLSPDTLQILKRIPVGALSGLTGSPQQSFVYAVQDDVLSVVDLVAGKVTAQLRSRDLFDRTSVLRPVIGDFKFATMTPDGKYLMSGGYNLNRFRIGTNGAELTFEEAGPGIGQNSQRLEVSPDSRYVALPSGGGNLSAPGHPQVGPYTTYVYKITDLQTPVITISSGAYPRALGFDKVAGYLYAQNFGMPLMVYTAGGLQQKTFRLARNATNRPGIGRGGNFGGGFGPGGETTMFLPHPQGRKLLVLMGERLVWVELPPPGQMMPEAPPAGPDTTRGNGGFGGFVGNGAFGGGVVF